MSKAAYLNDLGNHNMAHLMFYTPYVLHAARYGRKSGGLLQQCVGTVPGSLLLAPTYKGNLEPMYMFVISTGVWPDGTDSVGREWRNAGDFFSLNFDINSPAQ